MSVQALPKHSETGSSKHNLLAGTRSNVFKSKKSLDDFGTKLATTSKNTKNRGYFDSMQHKLTAFNIYEHGLYNNKPTSKTREKFKFNFAGGRNKPVNAWLNEDGKQGNKSNYTEQLTKSQRDVKKSK